MKVMKNNIFKKGIGCHSHADAACRQQCLRQAREIPKTTVKGSVVTSLISQ